MDDKISNSSVIDDMLEEKEKENHFKLISIHNENDNDHDGIVNNNNNINDNRNEIETNTNNDISFNHGNENLMIQASEPTTIFVGDLAYFTNENDLVQLFLPFNPLSVKIMRNVMTMKSMQYAFISFMSTDDAENAMFSLNGKRFKGRNLRINFAAYKSDLAAGIDQQLIPYHHRKPILPNANSVHVKFVSTIKNRKKNAVITEELLSHIFSIFGSVYDCSIKESAFDNKNNCQYGYGK